MQTVTHSSVAVALCQRCQEILAEGDGIPMYQDPRFGTSRLICEHVRTAEKGAARKRN